MQIQNSPQENLDAILNRLAPKVIPSIEKRYSKITMLKMKVRMSIIYTKVLRLETRIQQQKDREDAKKQRAQEREQKKTLRYLNKLEKEKKKIQEREEKKAMKEAQKLQKKQNKKQKSVVVVKEQEEVIVQQDPIQLLIEEQQPIQEQVQEQLQEQVEEQVQEQVQEQQEQLQEQVQEQPQQLCDLCQEPQQSVQCPNCLKQLCEQCHDNVKNNSRNCPFCRHKDMNLFGEYQEFVNETRDQQFLELLQEENQRQIIQEQQRLDNYYTLLFGENYIRLENLFDECDDFHEAFEKLVNLVKDRVLQNADRKEDDDILFTYVETQLANFFSGFEIRGFYDSVEDVNRYVIDTSSIIVKKYNKYVEKFQGNLTRKTIELSILFNYYIGKKLQESLEFDLQHNGYNRGSYKPKLQEYIKNFCKLEEVRKARDSYTFGMNDWRTYTDDAYKLFIEVYQPKKKISKQKK